MIRIDLLVAGSLEKDNDGNVTKADSTSTLIRTEDGIIVVDPSTIFLKPIIKKSFKQLGVYPNEVSCVVLTHSHRDHIENLSMFPNATVYVHEGEDMQVPGAIIVTDAKFQLMPNIRLVHTPGHTKGSMSVFIKSEQKYVIAGDAIPTENNFRRMVPPATNYDKDLALQSIKMIKRYADVVIPGHGFPFMARM
ncbi:MAG TPA: MBL fold metallo-hydrolase [Candidatus Methanomethylophilaceae archaeon]|nr:MBL fold metallo-hydrolase [Candidatus Methanomethylophilaceae archaeon]